MSVSYFIAQHIPDPFRQEPRNIGVFVQNGSATVARFVGERFPGEVDRRTIRAFDYPDVYLQWVMYWRRLLNTANGTAIEAIVKAGGTNFRVIRGGELTDEGSDSMESVLNYLYSMLVSEGRFAEAIAPADELAAEIEAVREGRIPLAKELEDVFTRMQILSRQDEPEFLVPHPIVKSGRIRGQKTDHSPEFVQHSDRLYVVETIDFRATNQIPRAVDHAGRAAYMFLDIKRAQPQTAPISVIRLPNEGYEDARVRHGITLVQGESRAVIWNDLDQQKEFLEERSRIAKGW